MPSTSTEFLSGLFVSQHLDTLKYDPLSEDHLGFQLHKFSALRAHQKPHAVELGVREL